jgi:hypothetical protein
VPPKVHPTKFCSGFLRTVFHSSDKRQYTGTLLSDLKNNFANNKLLIIGPSKIIIIASHNYGAAGGGAE